MTIAKNKKNAIVIEPKDAIDMGIIRNCTKDAIVNNKLVEILWPESSMINHFLTADALKKDLILRTFNNPKAKLYYKEESNKYPNLRRIIDLEIINCNKTTNNVKLNSLKKQDTSYKSNFILKSDKTISNLNQKNINEDFNNFFSVNGSHQNLQKQQVVNEQVNIEEEIEEFFDMNVIRVLALDYKILGERFLKLFEMAPIDQLPVLFKEVNSKLTGLDGEPYLEVFYAVDK